jgi:nondiscriminating glutamyl-tRNA synthetase
LPEANPRAEFLSDGLKFPQENFMVQKKVRVRFAPSPTGWLHVGNARTALFNWLFARKENGDFILRIEDTDAQRSAARYEEAIIADLRWLGLGWDEGPDIGGTYGPYKQSLRKKIYRRYAQNLIRKGQAYYCYCRPEELRARRLEAIGREESVRYDNRCRDLSAGKIRQLEKEGRIPTVRFKVTPREIVFRDLVRGEVKFDASLMGDFIIMRADGTPAFNFAVVLDDCLMEITHVIRGEDHLSNTPRHILLFEALGFPLPQFAHMSLTLGPDRKLLSKRHGATSIRSFREKGYLPEGLVNYLALLGWTHPEEREIMSTMELIEDFSLEGLAKSAAVFDREKLNWVDAHHIRRADPDRLAKLAIPFLRKKGFLDEEIPEEEYARVKNVVGALRAHLHCLSEIAEYAPIFFAGADKKLGQKPRTFQKEEVEALLDLIREDLSSASAPPEVFWKSTLEHARRSLGLKGKALYHPLRLILTGRSEGPELKDILPLIPLSTVRQRLEVVRARIKE